MTTFEQKTKALYQQHEELLTRKNEPITAGNSGFGTFRFSQNGIYEKYRYPVLTAEHTPLEWRYDFSEQDNPFLMQRIMMNAVLNAGAIKLEGRYLVVCRVEGADPGLAQKTPPHRMVRLHLRRLLHHAPNVSPSHAAVPQMGQSQRRSAVLRRTPSLPGFSRRA